jgi:O-phosphoseryl-tRNA(Cys) synthetase
MADKLIFTEYGLSYGSVLTPSNIQNNTTGTYDTGVFEAKAGISAMRWVEAYAGAAFYPFIFQANPQENYSFTPVFGGIKAKICPDWVVFPSFTAEYGQAAANIHTQYPVSYMSGGVQQTAMFDRDNAWKSSYYNFGMAINWNVTDMAVLSLKIERPTFTNINKSSGEIQILKVGLAWQIYY